MRSVSVVIALLVALSAAEVLKLDATTFPQHVGSPDKAVFVKFFAPWCGHCKALAPTWTELSEKFATSSKVEIAEVDCTVETKICGDFGVQGYPTLKFFPKLEKTSPLDYQGGRTIDELTKYVEDNADAKAAPAKKASSSAVVSLTKRNFNAMVVDNKEKATMVKFFAPWCGHCKALAPEYKKAAEAFAREKSVQVVEVDCDAEKELCSEYKVQGFPTVKFWKKGFDAAKDQPEDFNGERKAQSIVDWINERAGTKRALDGSLPADAGRIPELDAIAAQFMAAENKAALIVEAKAKVDKLEGDAAKNGKFYIKVMEKAMANKDFIAKEKARITNILAGNINQNKIDDFTVRLNIIGAF